jgi:histidinol-phosphate phosphatase family protein
MNKAVFLDRDGVINEKPPNTGYITRWEDFHILPDVAQAIALLNAAGFLAIVVTNQRCIALNLLAVSALEQIHAKMRDALDSQGAHLTAVYFCPHDNLPPCSCRKPGPGMLLTAAAEHNIDLSASWMIGDSVSDIEAGKRAGAHTMLLTHSPSSPHSVSDQYADSLLSAADKILALNVVADL